MGGQQRNVRQCCFPIYLISNNYDCEMNVLSCILFRKRETIRKRIFSIDSHLRGDRYKGNYRNGNFRSELYLCVVVVYGTIYPLSHLYS